MHVARSSDEPSTVANPEGGDHALLGRRVGGKFVIEEFLGGGSMGIVYRARDESLERNVALKVMQPAVAIDPSFVERFQKEARAASRLEHPNVLHVIEFGEEPDGLLYIAMEYLDGRDLHRVIHEDWPLSPERVADVMMKGLAALAVAHEMGVIHRDLKPENIMVLSRKDDEGRDTVKVCDFGIAQITERDDGVPGARPRSGAKLTTPGLVVGTAEYMSPEQARGEPLDARADLYSMGIILYQLLTGRTPFVADTAVAVIVKQVSETPVSPRTIYAGVHEALEAVCMKSIAKPRERRFQSAREMRGAIKAAIEGRPMPVDSTSVTVAAPIIDERQEVRAQPAVSTNSEIAQLATGSRAEAIPSPDEAHVTTANVLTVDTAQPAAVTTSRSRRGLLVGVVLGLAAAAPGIAFVSRQPTTGVGVLSPPPAVSSSILVNVLTPDPRSPTEPATASSSNAAATASSSNAVTLVARDPRRLGVVAATGKAPGQKGTPALGRTLERTEAPPPEPLSSVAPEPAAQAPLQPPPQPVIEAPAPPPRAPALVAFNAGTCRAQLGAARSASAYSVKDLAVHGAEAAWTSCARSSIHERPGPGIAGVVRVRFRDSRTFEGATCIGCPGPLAACVASATERTVSVQFRSGDATGDPEFDIPVTFTCE